MKKTLLFTLIALFIAPIAYSAVTDAFLINVTPSVSISVLVDTNNATMDFGNIGLSEVRLSTIATGVSSATIENNGSVSADWQIMANKADVWDIRPRSYQDINTVAADTITLCAILSPYTSSHSNIFPDSFQSDDMLGGGSDEWFNMRASSFTCVTNTALARFHSDGNDVVVSSRRILHVRMKSPSNTSVTSAQKFHINIRALVMSTF